MADRRTKAQKLQDLINHPRTSENERQAARLAMKRLGVRPAEPHRPPPPRNSYVFREASYTAAFTASQEFWDALFTRAGPPPPRPKPEPAPACPGCGHAEDVHVSFRCYACGTKEVNGYYAFGADACSWFYGLVNGRPGWIKIEGPWTE